MQPDEPAYQPTIAAEILRQTQALGPARSICPSAVARALAPGLHIGDWRALMAPVRTAAAALARDGRIDILRKGKPIAPAAIHGVIRLRLRGDPPRGTGPG
jgi:hypothetical protein